MNGHQIDELLKRKVDSARRGRTLRTAVALLACLALIVLIGTAIHRHKAKAVSVPDDPSTVEADPEQSPDESEPPVQTKDGQKPLQPEEIRRLQTRHELELLWQGVPEDELPPMVTVRVIHQGEEVARFTLSEENEWRHSWSDNYSADTLTLRAELPKTVRASFALRGGKFTITGSYGSAAAPAPADAGGEAAEDGDAPEQTDGETPEQTRDEPSEGSEAPEEPAQAQSGKIDAPEPDGEAASEDEADEEAGEAPEEISDLPRTGRSWWPVVLLTLCGAALVTLGMLGTDRRRSR